jgi:cytochrome c-type biogenesis protein CcmH/NrfG
VRRLFWPGDLAIYYPHPVSSTTVAVTVMALALLISVSAAAWLLRRRAPVLLAGWLWFGLILGPVIGLMQIGAQGMADRYFYLSGLGLITAVVWLAADFVSRRAQVWLAASGLALFTAMSAQQVGFWQNSLTVFDHAVIVTKKNSMAHLCLGLMEYGQGSKKDARVHLKRAVEISPGMSTAWENLARIEVLAGNDLAAIKAYAGALSAQARNTSNMVQLGCLLSKVGRKADAEKVFKKMREVAPQASEALLYLGTLYAEGQRWPEAVSAWEEYLTKNAGNDWVRTQLQAAKEAAAAPPKPLG